jgi:hypothetical protein
MYDFVNKEPQPQFTDKKGDLYKNPKQEEWKSVKKDLDREYQNKLQ